ncbi:MAG: hypothetical protein JWM76_2970 [Pseudonocardiales bacterium]|nr:hypothetical protein [Pseudonocardiales bacterium]
MGHALARPNPTGWIRSARRLQIGVGDDLGLLVDLLLADLLGDFLLLGDGLGADPDPLDGDGLLGDPNITNFGTNVATLDQALSRPEL